MLIYEYRYKVSKRLSVIFGEWQSYAENRSERTQEEFSKLIGVEKKALISWLRGTTLPKLEQIYQICRICNCSADWLLMLSDDKKGVLNHDRWRS